MADEPETGELAAEDKAYFESRGEKIPQEKPTPDKVEKPDEKETKAETEAETDLDVLDEEAPKEDKKVPLRALTKEREEGKKARQALQELEKRHAVLEDRWNTILQLNQQPEVKAEDVPPPDPDTDIFAALKYEREKRQALEKQFTEKTEAEKQAAMETQRETAVWNLWTESSKAKAAETPDFKDAVKWMSDTRIKQLSAMKAFQPQFQTQEGIDKQIDTELKQIIIASAQQGISPADYVYGMAKEWGYTGPGPDPIKDDGGAVDKLAKNLDAETSLSGAGGSRPSSGTDARAISDMNNEDFDRWLSKAGPNGFKKLFQRGGTA